MGVGRRMRRAILLLALATLLLGGQASPGKKKEFQVLPAIPTQIEEPPAESAEVQNDQEDDGKDDKDDKDDEGWDVDYIVKYSIIVSATASDAAPLQYLAPYSGAA